MLAKASRLLKIHAPRLHASLKLALLRAQLPVPKLLRGRLVFVAPQLFGSRPTELHVLKWIDERLRPGDTFYDIGAHYGWMSLLACRRVGAKGMVIAFEPSPPLVKFLLGNKKANRFSQLRIVPKAVADSVEREAPFYLKDQGDSFLNTLVPRVDQNPANPSFGKSSVPVETTTRDVFCQETQLIPAAVKIDVEGQNYWSSRVQNAAETPSPYINDCRAPYLAAARPDRRRTLCTPAFLRLSSN
jgi:FkbM family methyltransferase